MVPQCIGGECLGRPPGDAAVSACDRLAGGVGPAHCTRRLYGWAPLLAVLFLTIQVGAAAPVCSDLSESMATHLTTALLPVRGRRRPHIWGRAPALDAFVVVAPALGRCARGGAVCKRTLHSLVLRPLQSTRKGGHASCHPVRYWGAAPRPAPLRVASIVPRNQCEGKRAQRRRARA